MTRLRKRLGLSWTESANEHFYSYRTAAGVVKKEGYANKEGQSIIIYGPWINERKTMYCTIQKISRGHKLSKRPTVFRFFYYLHKNILDRVFIDYSMHTVQELRYVGITLRFYELEF